MACTHAVNTHAECTSVVAGIDSDFTGASQSTALLQRGLHFGTSTLSKEQDDLALERASAARPLLQSHI